MGGGSAKRKARVKLGLLRDADLESLAADMPRTVSINVRARDFGASEKIARALCEFRRRHNQRRQAYGSSSHPDAGLAAAACLGGCCMTAFEQKRCSDPLARCRRPARSRTVLVRRIQLRRTAFW